MSFYTFFSKFLKTRQWINHGPKNPIPLALLGGRGTVGQKVIALINSDPLLSQWFFIKEITSWNIPQGTNATKNPTYGETFPWKDPLIPCPQYISDLSLISYKDVKCPYVVSCLGADQAIEAESFLMARGHKIFSNASAFRLSQEGPLCVPEINGQNLWNLAKNHSEDQGFIVTNPNCVAVPTSLVLFPLKFLKNTLRHVSITSLQSLSGAGYPGVSSMDIMGNTIPFIAQEREKILLETKALLGPSKEDSCKNPESFSDISRKEKQYKDSEENFFHHVTFSSQVHRVPVPYGHTVSLHMVFENPVDLSDFMACYEETNTHYTAAPWDTKKLFTWSSPLGPQSRYLPQDFMGVQLGQLTHGSNPSVISLTALTHNLVRGAAGAVINNLLYFILGRLWLSLEEKH